MKKQQASVDVNFIEDKFSLVNKIAKWIVIYGVIFVILTVVAIVGTTAWNLVLDRQVADLDTQIEARLSEIRQFGEFEKDFLQIQDKLDQYKTTLNQERMEDLLPRLTTVTPQGVVMEEMSITPTTVTIGGTAISQNDLANFVQNIMLIEREEFADGQRVEFVNLAVNEINSIGGNQLGFEFNIQFDYQFKS